MNETQPKSSNLLLYSVIGILLIGLATLTFMWSAKRSELNQCQNDNLILKSDMEGMNKMLEGYVGGLSNDLKTDFKNMLDTYDRLIEMDQSKADSLNKQKAQISQLLKQLNTNKKLSARELFNLKKENEVLRSIMRGYVKQIDSLNTLNIKLTSVLDETNTKLTETTTERDTYKKDAEQKTEQLKKGAKLQAYGFNSEALRMKFNNTTEPTTKAKNVIQMRSSFTIGENQIASSGRKSVYLQIIGPNGEVLQSKANYVMETENGQQGYSDKKDIDYNNQAIDLTIYYDLKGLEVGKGNYKVRVYCEGQLIGTDSFTLK
jgi:F0F1-type ATP synthase membrane subunit b/b'